MDVFVSAYVDGDVAGAPEDVPRLRLREGDALSRRGLVLGVAGYVDARLRVAPLCEPRAVEADPGNRPSPYVRHPQLAFRRGDDRVAVGGARPEVLQAHPVEAPEAVFVHRRFEHLDVARRGRVPRVLQSLGHPVRVARGYGLPDEGVADIRGTGQEDARAEHDAVAMALERREVGHDAHDLASDLLARRP